MTKRNAPSPCSQDGCPRAVRARGLCSTHYNQQQPGRHKPREVACTFCGQPTLSTGGGGRKHGPTCSTLCRTRLTHGWSEPLPMDHWARWYGKSSTWRPPDKQPARFIGGTCAECAATFIGVNNGDPHRYCTTKCRRRVERRVRRALEAEATGSHHLCQVEAKWIALNRCCAYCHKPTAKYEADHVVPLSRGGSNDISNIVPACGPCNRDKRALLIPEWQVERVRRGMEALTMHALLTGPLSA